VLNRQLICIFIVFSNDLWYHKVVSSFSKNIKNIYQNIEIEYIIKKISKNLDTLENS
jgi:hypothetical protein